MVQGEIHDRLDEFDAIGEAIEVYMLDVPHVQILEKSQFVCCQAS